jgi:hypothetical protein
LAGIGAIAQIHLKEEKSHPEIQSTQLVYFLDENDLKRFPQEEKPDLSDGNQIKIGPDD